MIYPLEEGREYQAKLTGTYKKDELDTGVFHDDHGNVFKSCSPQHEEK